MKRRTRTGLKVPVRVIAAALAVAAASLWGAAACRYVASHGDPSAMDRIVKDCTKQYGPDGVMVTNCSAR